MGRTHGNGRMRAFDSSAVFVVLLFLISGPAAGAPISPLDGFPPVFYERITCSSGSSCTVIDESINDETPEDITADFSGSLGGDSFQFVARALTSGTPSGPLSSPFGSVEANAVGSIDGAAQVVVRYSFAIQGPESATGTVPVIITTRGFASAIGSGTGASESFSEAFFGSYGYFARADACFNGGESGCVGPGADEFAATWNAVMDPFSGDSDFSYDVFELQLSARTYVSGWSDSADGEAVIDPVIAIDPSFATADQYTVLLTDGLVNGGAVPEPGASTLFGLGLAGIAAMRRLRTAR